MKAEIGKWRKKSRTANRGGPRRLGSSVIVLVAACATVLAGCSSSGGTSESPQSGAVTPAANASTQTETTTTTTPTDTTATSAESGPTGTEPVSPPSGEPLKLTLGVPGIGTTYVANFIYQIGKGIGMFKKFGLDLTIRHFASGTDATRAASTGKLDFALTPAEQLVVLQSKGVKMTSFVGLPTSDWVIGSTDPSIKTCQDLKGQTFGVEAIGGIRQAALAAMMKNVCGLSIKDVHLVVAPGQAPQQLISGQLKVNLLHSSEAAKVEQQMGKPLTIVMTAAKALSNTMYDVSAALTSKIASKKQAFERFTAGYIATINWLQNPANMAKAGQIIGGLQKIDPKVSANAIKSLVQEGFWPVGSPGLPEANWDNLVNHLVSVGTIEKSSAPSYSDLVDSSVYSAAAKLVKP